MTEILKIIIIQILLVTGGMTYALIPISTTEILVENTWSFAAPLPFPRSHFSSATIDNSVVIFGIEFLIIWFLTFLILILKGGQDGDRRDVDGIHRYRPGSKDKWTPAGKMTTPRSGIAVDVDNACPGKTVYKYFWWHLPIQFFVKLTANGVRGQAGEVAPRRVKEGVRRDLENASLLSTGASSVREMGPRSENVTPCPVQVCQQDRKFSRCGNQLQFSPQIPTFFQRKMQWNFDIHYQKFCRI